MKDLEENGENNDENKIEVVDEPCACLIASDIFRIHVHIRKHAKQKCVSWERDSAAVVADAVFIHLLP